MCNKKVKGQRGAYTFLPFFLIITVPNDSSLSPQPSLRLQDYLPLPPLGEDRRGLGGCWLPYSPRISASITSIP